jgi:hypothetical protein
MKSTPAHLPAIFNLYLCGNNASVIKNVTLPESMLHKRHNSITYHKYREECAGGVVRVLHESGKEICSDAAVGAPLGGVDYLLGIVGFHNLAEHLHIIKAGLTDYEDFHYLIDKDTRNMAEEFAK